MTVRKRWRQANRKDILDVVSRLRSCDEEEVRAMTNMSPSSFFSLQTDFSNTYVIFNSDGLNVALAGITPLDNDTAIIWMLATHELEKHQMEFLKHTRTFIDEIAGSYQLLFNWVYAKNEVHIKWLRWCGFTFINKHEVFGAQGKPFYTFVRTKDE